MQKTIISVIWRNAGWRTARCTRLAAAALLLASCGGLVAPDENSIRSALASGSRHIRLPAGVIPVSSEIAIPSQTTIEGAGPSTILRAAPGFHGRALLVIHDAAGARLRDFAIDGNRGVFPRRSGLPPDDVPFRRFTVNNGVLANVATDLRISGVQFRNLDGFAVLAASASGLLLDDLLVEDSGGRNAAGRNNATGGILIEEGTKDFQVVNSVFRRIRGNAVWTHSLYRSPRNGPGSIADNRFEDIGRDAIQVGHASAVRVERNVGRRIGYPFEEIDVEGGAVPVGIDTAGNVDRSAYSRNRFEEVNGKCIDLDGFHNGEVRSNVCLNRGSASDYPSGGYAIVMNNTNPDMRPAGVWIEGNEIDGARFGGIFVIGASNRVTGNTLRNLNLARCTGPSQPGCDYAPDQPDLLRSGIYLGSGAERPAAAEDNEIRANHISGFRLENRCVAVAPGVSLTRNRVSGNTCRSLP